MDAIAKLNIRVIRVEKISKRHFHKGEKNPQDCVLKTHYDRLTKYRKLLYSLDVSEARLAGIVL